MMARVAMSLPTEAAGTGVVLAGDALFTLGFLVFALRPRG